MPLTVQFVGPVKRPSPARELDVNPADFKTVSELLSHLGYNSNDQKALQVILDENRADLDSPLQGAKNMQILIAIGGG